MLFVSCQDNVLNRDTPAEEGETLVHFEVNYPIVTKAAETPSSREDIINDLHVLIFPDLADGAGTLTNYGEVAPSDFIVEKPDGGTNFIIKFSVSLGADAYDGPMVGHIFANAQANIFATLEEGVTTEAEMFERINTGDVQAFNQSETAPIPMHGYFHSHSDVLSDETIISTSIKRSMAKVVLNVAPDLYMTKKILDPVTGDVIDYEDEDLTKGKFEVYGFSFHYTTTTGAHALNRHVASDIHVPAGATVVGGKVKVTSGTSTYYVTHPDVPYTKNHTDEGNLSTYPIYIYDYDVSEGKAIPRLVLQGRFDNEYELDEHGAPTLQRKYTYYTYMLLDSAGEPFNIVRNNVYTINVTRITSEGSPDDLPKFPLEETVQAHIGPWNIKHIDIPTYW